jgi:hypothetical protein
MLVLGMGIKRPWRAVGLFAFVLVALGILVAYRLRPHRRPPFELSFWYWHSPFQISPAQSRDLKTLGVTRLFVRAGTFSSDGRNMVLVIPQKYGAGGSGFRIHQVFNFDTGVVRHFESYDLERIAGQIAKRVNDQVQRGKQAGLDVEGVQFDFDCPTRLLSRYAELVRLVRQQLPGRPTFSATALMSWLGTKGVAALSRQVDFLAPQAYEGVTGNTVDTMRPVSDEQDFRRRIARADGLACPFYVGVPAYGHAFLFDPAGKLLDVYRGLEPADAFRHPAFNLILAEPSDRFGHPAKSPTDSVGEEIVKFRAVRPALNGQGLDDFLAYTVPTPVLLERMLRAVRETRSENCLGAIIYRMPEGDSSMTVPWRSLMEGLAGRSIPPKLKIGLESRSDAFDLIESAKPLPDAPKDLDLKIENIGGPTFLGPDALEVDVVLERPGFDEVRRRDMDSAVPGILEGGRVTRCAPDRANVASFSRFGLGAGQSIAIGPIQLLSSKRQHISVRWRTRDSDGFQTESGQVEFVQ